MSLHLTLSQLGSLETNELRPFYFASRRIYDVYQLIQFSDSIILNIESKDET